MTVLLGECYIQKDATSVTPATSGVPTLIFTKVQHSVRFIRSNYKICSQLTSGRCITLQSLTPFLNLKTMTHFNI